MRMEHVGTCCPSRCWFWLGTRWSQNCLWKPTEKAHDISFTIKERLSIQWDRFRETASFQYKASPSPRVSFWKRRVSLWSRLHSQRTVFLIYNCVFLSKASFLAKVRLEGSSQLEDVFCRLCEIEHWKLQTIQNAILLLFFIFYETSERTTYSTAVTRAISLGLLFLVPTFQAIVGEMKSCLFGRYRYWECWDTMFGICKCIFQYLPCCIIWLFSCWSPTQPIFFVSCVSSVHPMLPRCMATRTVLE